MSIIIAANSGAENKTIVEDSYQINLANNSNTLK